MTSCRTGLASFTLIELLTVIAIVAILVALLFPAVNKTIQKGEITQAKGDIKNIEQAIRAYVNEYGVLPGCSGTSDTTYNHPNNSAVIQPLMVRTGTLASQNPRGVAFLQTPSRKNAISTSYVFQDPWARAYKIILDCDYNNTISSDGTQHGITVISSFGPDAVEATSDDIVNYK